MLEYSPKEFRRQVVAMKSLFHLTDDDIDNSKDIQQWMQSAPISIVEHESPLKNESEQGRDERCQIYNVYDGDVSELYKYLTELYPRESAKYSEWELIYSIANSLKHFTHTSSSNTEVGNASNEKKEVAKHSQKSKSSEAIKTDTVEQHTVPKVDTSQVPALDSSLEHKVEKNVSNINTSVNKENKNMDNVINELNGIQSATTDLANIGAGVMPAAGNVDTTLIKSFTTEQFVAWDKKSMGAFAAAAGAGAKAAVEAEVKARVDGTVKDADKVLTAYQAQEIVAKFDKALSSKAKSNAKDAAKAYSKEVDQAFGSQLVARSAYAKDHLVEKIVAVKQPSALRLLATSGTMFKPDAFDTSKPEDQAKQKEAFEKRANAFARKVSGISNITWDKFTGLDDATKYANVVADEKGINVEKAKGIAQYFAKAANDPGATFPAKKANPSYTIKGYIISGDGQSKPYTNDAALNLIIDKTPGYLYTPGALNEQGGLVSKEATYLKLTSVNDRKAATRVKSGHTLADSAAIDAVVKKVPVISVKNRKKFIEDPSNIELLYPELDKDAGSEYVSCSALVTVNGEEYPATVSTYSLDASGNKITTSVDKDNMPVYKKTMASFRIVVPATPVKKVLASEFIGANETEGQAATAWGLKVQAKGIEGGLDHVVTLAGSPVGMLLQQYAAGQIDVDGLKDVSIIVDMKNRLDQKAALAVNAEKSQLD